MIITTTISSWQLPGQEKNNTESSPMASWRWITMSFSRFHHLKGHLTIQQRSQRIAMCFFSSWKQMWIKFSIWNTCHLNQNNIRPSLKFVCILSFCCFSHSSRGFATPVVPSGPLVWVERPTTTLPNPGAVLLSFRVRFLTISFNKNICPKHTLADSKCVFCTFFWRSLGGELGWTKILLNICGYIPESCPNYTDPSTVM